MPPLPSEAEEDGEEGEWQSADQLPSYPGQATFVSGATAPLPMEEAGAPLPEEVAPLPSDNDLYALTSLRQGLISNTMEDNLEATMPCLLPCAAQFHACLSDDICVSAAVEASGSCCNNASASHWDIEL